MWTCTACRLEFGSPAEQKEHFRSDWHRYNLKRKVVELPPVTEEQFTFRMQKVLADKQAQLESDPKMKQKLKKEEIAKAGAKTVTKCMPCGKTFATSNAFDNHLTSKKHVAAAKKHPEAAAAVATITKKLEVVQVGAVDTEKAGDADDDQKAGEPTMSLEEYKKQIPLDKEDCIFCAHRATDLDACLSHMLKEHGFFVPDVDYLVDLEGLVGYLAEKVKIGHFCLYCNGKGKSFRSYQDVQKHMTALSHCKLLYEENEDMEELLDFYDFSPQYKKKTKNASASAADGAEGGEAEWETDSEASIGDDEEVVEVEDAEEEDDDDDEFEEEDEYTIGVSETGELVLSNGRRIGQRDFRRYYRQRFRPDDKRESVLAATKERLLLAYQAAGVDAAAGSTALSTAFVANFMKRRTNNIVGGMTVHQAKVQNHHVRKQKERLDKRSHKLQKNPNRRILVTV